MSRDAEVTGLPYQQFLHCPRCGAPAGQPPPDPVFRCAGCGFTFFFNPAVAAGAFLMDPARGILFVRRARDPARGQLALPGGFIDYHETAEAGLRREIREEVGLEVGPLRFLCSQVNRYEYNGIVYPVVDLFFEADCPADAAPDALDGVAGLAWLRPEEVRPEELAFPSIREAFARLRASEGRPTPP